MAERAIDKDRILLGEGKDEELFLKTLLQFEHISNVQVMEYGGKTKLKTFLKELPKLPRFGEVVALGITRDADESEASAKDAVESALAGAGLKLGAAPGQPMVLMHVLHLNGCGMLEDVCLASLAERPELECVDKYLACCVEKGRPAPPNFAKARVHAWLASKDLREYQLGRAAEKQPPIIDLGHPAFDPLRAFVREVAGVVP
jgi:hypothetical protein